ncbi:MAG: hypothetical protein E4G99_11325 [Anaerolineales bacterium]|nr:MAG: hypothetical protein E4G99_11325 [Anaerolineales bacterium]
MNPSLTVILLNFLNLIFAVQVLRAKRLIWAAIWLACTSATTAFVCFVLGAFQVAVIELSVGAGLVTVLFVFVINIAGEEPDQQPKTHSRWIPLLAVIIPTLLIGASVLAIDGAQGPASADNFVNTFWEHRGLDVLVQVVLIFAGVLGLLGLLAEAKAPLEQSMLAEFARLRERDLKAIGDRSLIAQEAIEAGLNIPESGSNSQAETSSGQLTPGGE